MQLECCYKVLGPGLGQFRLVFSSIAPLWRERTYHRNGLLYREWLKMLWNMLSFFFYKKRTLCVIWRRICQSNLHFLVKNNERKGYTSRFFRPGYVGLIYRTTAVATASWSTFEGTLGVLCRYCDRNYRACISCREPLMVPQLAVATVVLRYTSPT